MTKKTRYLLLLLGFIVFIILAPVIVLYVRGITYDFNKKAFVTTGILAVRSEPKDAGIYLNNKLKKDSSGDLKFIVPGEYEVAVKKPGYFPWSKRLTIESGQVTWGSPAFNKIYLLLYNPPVRQVAEKVVDAYGQTDSVAYLTEGFLNILPIADSKTSKKYPLPEMLNLIANANAGMDNIILSGDSAKTFLFSKSSEKFYDLSGLFKNPVDFNFNNGELFALSSSTIYKIDPDKKTKTELFSNIKAFNFQDGLLYFIQTKPGQKPGLYTSQAPFASGQELIKDLPDFSSTKLFVTYEKQIFLIADGDLYLTNSTMEKMADNVSFYNFQTSDSALAVIHSGQADFYDPLARHLNYITRTSENIKSLAVRNNIGQAFFITNGKINSIELDARDKQNQYLLYNGLAEKFFIDGAGKNIILLDGGILKSMVIR